MNSIRRLSVLMLATGIAMSAVSCASDTKDNGSNKFESNQETPEKSMESVVHAISDISLKYADMTEDEMTASEKEISEYFDPEVDPETRNDVITIFAQVLEMDPEATIDIDPKKIQEDGDTAKLHGKDIEVTMYGELQEATEAGGVIVLKLQGGKWVISDIEIPNLDSSIMEEEITEDPMYVEEETTDGNDSSYDAYGEDTNE